MKYKSKEFLVDTGSSSIESMDPLEIPDVVAIPEPENDDIFFMIREIWLDVLCLEAVGPEEDFLFIGGESISAVRVVNRVNEALDIAVPVKGLYENSTLATFHQYVLSFVSVVETGSI